MTRGVGYVAMGRPHIEEAILSAEQLKSVCDLPVTLIADRPTESQYLDETIVLSDPVGGPGDQMEAMHRMPYDETLLLDTDIFVVDDPREVFALLEEFDIAIAHAPHRKDADNSTIEEPPVAFPEYNSGVVAYRWSTEIEDFLDQWSEEWQRDNEAGLQRNQPSFRRALYRSDLRIATLPPEYNCRIQLPGQASLPVKIFHGRLTSVDREGGGMAHVLDVSTVAEKINSKDGPRVFYPSSKGVKVKHYSDLYLYRIRYSIKRHGVMGTIKRVLTRIN